MSRKEIRPIEIVCENDRGDYDHEALVHAVSLPDGLRVFWDMRKHDDGWADPVFVANILTAARRGIDFTFIARDPA